MTTQILDVLLPVRSPAPWLEETLRGLKEQTYSDFNLRVLLHGPDPRSRELVFRIFPEAVVEEYPSHLNFSDLLNLGLQQSQARYIARIDADDIPLPTRFARQIEVMESNLMIGLVATSVILIDSNGNRIRTRYLPAKSKALSARLRWKNIIPHPSVMFRRQLVVELGGYNSRALHAEDYELWLRMGQNSRLVSIVEPLTFYRVHSAQISRVKYLSSDCINAVAVARCDFAISRGESLILQRIRHQFWALRQHQRRIAGRSA